MDKNEPFYIGIGTKSKQDLKYGYYGRASAKHVDNNIWLKIAAKTECKWEILLESDDRKFIENKEIEFISIYGRKCDNKGILANLTLGGESNLGYKHTEETIRKISEKSKRKRGFSNVIYTKELRDKLSDIQKKMANRPDRIEYRRQLAKGNSYHLGCKHSEETKQKMSSKAKKRAEQGILNCKTIKCKLIDKINNSSWEANSLAALSRIAPISHSTISRLSQGLKVSSKTSEQYKLIKYE